MKVKQIAFLGDSWTWGEGLELYLDTPIWINQRNKQSIWTDLVKIQTDESILFREKNRFVNIVAEYFNSDIVIDKSNGGCIRSLTNQLNNIFSQNLIPEFVVIQFSSFVRNSIHYHLGSFASECKCNLCINNQPHGTIYCLYHLRDVVIKKYASKEKLNNQDLFYINWLKTEFNFDSVIIENNSNPFNVAYNYIDSIIDSYSLLHLNFLLDTYVTKLEERGSKVFYIDSWDMESSKICHLVPDIQKNMIELQGYENRIITKNYYEFETTFPYTRISSEFPKTDNGHPTLIQHQHIANSIIDKIENFDKKSFFQKLF